MDRERARELLPIFEAFAEGRTVQERSTDTEAMTLRDWQDMDEDTQWMIDHDCYEYRIKPEPRTYWINADNGTAMLANDGWEPKERMPHYIKVREVLDD